MPSTSAKRFAIWSAILIPPLCFYYLLSKSLTRLPFLDDYWSVLEFLLKWKQEHGLQHAVQILTSQHNEYRLMFENFFFGMQYAILGHTDLRGLSILGDLLVIPMFGVLYLLWREGDDARRNSLLSFVPASWILFQLQYASSLNNAMAPLQNLAVILFALLSCYLAARPGDAALIGSLCSLLLCIASSGNGLFLIPIGAVMFLQQKNYKRFAAWCLTSLLMVAVYFHGYNFHASQAHADKSLLSSIQHLAPAYGAAFLGSLAAKANPAPAVVFGFLLLAIFLYATWERLFVTRPGLYYSMLFFFGTGFAVSGLRSDLGLVTALGSRYRINSAILVILIYFYLVRKLEGRQWSPSIQVPAICVFALALIGFNLMSDRAGHKLLLTRRQKLEAAMLRWERHEPKVIATTSEAGDYTAENEKKGFYEPVEPFLTDAIREGIYQLPNLPDEH